MQQLMAAQRTLAARREMSEELFKYRKCGGIAKNDRQVLGSRITDLRRSAISHFFQLACIYHVEAFGGASEHRRKVVAAFPFENRSSPRHT